MTAATNAASAAAPPRVAVLDRRLARQRLPGDAQEHVVQAGLLDGHALQPDARAVQRAHQLGHVLRGALEVQAQLAVGRLAARGHRGQHIVGPRRVLAGPELQLDDLFADLALELRRRAAGDDPALVDDGDLVGQAVGLLEVLRGEEDRHAELVVEAAHFFPDRRPAGRVEARGGLVQEQDTGVVDEGEGQVEAALHASGVRARRASWGPPRPGRPCSSSRSAGLPRLVARGPEQLRLQDEQLARRHQRVEPDVLQRDADRLAHLAALALDVVAGDRRVRRSGSGCVVRIFTSVDLPAPLGPRKPKICPPGTSRSTPSTAWSSPKSRRRLSAVMLRSFPSWTLIPPPCCARKDRAKPSLTRSGSIAAVPGRTSGSYTEEGDMPLFESRAVMPVAAEELFAYHARPGAFERLAPPGRSSASSSRPGACGTAGGWRSTSTRVR